MTYPLVIIGGGLSGLAAGIRFARFGQKVLILEKHTIAGGLNSYYYRRGYLLETGLHAITNYAPPEDRHAPLNKILRQLKLSRTTFPTHEQLVSEVRFQDRASLLFSNDFSLLTGEIRRQFPGSIDQFTRFVQRLDGFDPLTPRPWLSTYQELRAAFSDPLLIDMLLLPLMIYGNGVERDMDFSQFVIMFRAIYQEGLFRPAGTMKDFLDLLVAQYCSFGGEIRFQAAVRDLIVEAGRVTGLRLQSGEEIECDQVISTAGYPATLRFLGASQPEAAERYEGKISFFESIYLLPQTSSQNLTPGRTIIFYNNHDEFTYCRPDTAVDPDMGVICFAGNFAGLPGQELMQLRVTNPANYALWRMLPLDDYRLMKKHWMARSQEVTGKIIGNYRQNIVYEDSFTPLTIERFTAKAQGAVYGSPVKLKDGRTPFANLFIAGTDQGFLGVVGSMLSGITIVNQHILGKDNAA